MGLIQNDSPANPALLHGKGKFYKWRVFVVAFIAYASLHAVRTSWGSVKPGVHRDLGWENSFLGTLDMLFLIFYGFGLLGSGIIGDYVNRRRFLTVGMLMAFMGYLVMGIAGLTHSVSKLLIAAAFSFNGLGESTVQNIIKTIANNLLYKYRDGQVTWQCWEFGLQGKI